MTYVCERECVCGCVCVCARARACVREREKEQNEMPENTSNTSVCTQVRVCDLMSVCV